MRATSGIVSLTTHVMLVAAALWATEGVHARASEPPIIVDLGPGPVSTSDEPLPGGPVIGGLTIPNITLPNIPGGRGGDTTFPGEPRVRSRPALCEDSFRRRVADRVFASR